MEVNSLLLQLSDSAVMSTPFVVEEDLHQVRTLWFADGSSFPARITKVQSDGIQILNEGAAKFVNASDLSTFDRVHFGFGSRKEESWVARLSANQAKQKRALELLK